MSLVEFQAFSIGNLHEGDHEDVTSRNLKNRVAWKAPKALASNFLAQFISEFQLISMKLTVKISV